LLDMLIGTSESKRGAGLHLYLQRMSPKIKGKK